jgi:WD40-like Beta Propeller Repeat
VVSGRQNPGIHKVVYRLGYTYESVTLETLRLGAKEATELISDVALDEGVSWLPDGRILFSRMEDLPNQVSSNVLAARIDPRTGHLEGAPTPLTSGPDVKMVLGASADGKRLAFLRTNIVPSIYVGRLTAGNTELSGVEKLTLDEQQNRPYDWPPDSKAIFFISNREGGFHIFRQQPGQAAPEMVVGGTDMINVVRLNADGRELLYLAESPRPEGMKAAMNRAALWMRTRANKPTSNRLANIPNKRKAHPCKHPWVSSCKKANPPFRRWRCASCV